MDASIRGTNGIQNILSYACGETGCCYVNRLRHLGVAACEKKRIGLVALSQHPDTPFIAESRGCCPGAHGRGQARAFFSRLGCGRHVACEILCNNRVFSPSFINSMQQLRLVTSVHAVSLRSTSPRPSWA